ncbi:hypothetical protein [Streptococcus jiangjianxini]|uniref:hypothetical protein n=1 Tax=Streptococcus jiangjianxini TaxID=3161189 RepID=UPI0032EB90F6
MSIGTSLVIVTMIIVITFFIGIAIFIYAFRHMIKGMDSHIKSREERIVRMKKRQ